MEFSRTLIISNKPNKTKIHRRNFCGVFYVMNPERKEKGLSDKCIISKFCAKTKSVYKSVSNT